MITVTLDPGEAPPGTIQGILDGKKLMDVLWDAETGVGVAVFRTGDLVLGERQALSALIQLRLVTNHIIESQTDGEVM